MDFGAYLAKKVPKSMDNCNSLVILERTWPIGFRNPGNTSTFYRFWSLLGPEAAKIKGQLQLSLDFGAYLALRVLKSRKNYNVLLILEYT